MRKCESRDSYASTSYSFHCGAQADKFKTLGSHAPVIRSDNKQALIIDEETQAELERLRREALEAMRSKSPNGDLLGSGKCRDRSNGRSAR
jgi:hypothetical protein